MLSFRKIYCMSMLACFAFLLFFSSFYSPVLFFHSFSVHCFAFLFFVSFSLYDFVLSWGSVRGVGQRLEKGRRHGEGPFFGKAIRRGTQARPASQRLSPNIDLDSRSGAHDLFVELDFKCRVAARAQRRDIPLRERSAGEDGPRRQGTGLL